MTRQPGKPPTRTSAIPDFARQSSQVDLDDIAESITRVAQTLINNIDAARPGATTEVYGTTGGDRIVATSRSVAAARDDLATWTRVLAEVAVEKFGIPQRKVAASLGISTHTLTRWLRDPVLLEDAALDEAELSDDF